MREPIIVGVLGGILVALAVVGLFVVIALGRESPPLSTVPPQRPSSSADSTESASPSPTPVPSPSPSPTPVPSPSGTATPSPSTSPSGSTGGSTSPEVGLDVGDLAPALDLQQLGGGRINTSELAGQPLWINFMATWCPPCRDELPLMDRFQARLGDDMTILLVDVGESSDVVQAFMDSLVVDLPVGLDGDGSAQRRWGAVALPLHYWIDGDGRISAFVFGGAEPDAFIEAVRTVLPDAELAP